MQPLLLFSVFLLSAPTGLILEFFCVFFHFSLHIHTCYCRPNFRIFLFFFFYKVNANDRMFVHGIVLELDQPGMHNAQSVLPLL